MQLGLLADQGLNVETGGVADETLSMRSARAAARGDRTACIFCRILGVLVQRRHCAKQLSGEPMHPLNYVRAALAIAVAYGVQVWGIGRIARAITGVL